MVRKGKEAAAGSGGLAVSAQQSRFHVVDSPASKEILVKDLCIAVDQRELLSHAELHLKEGTHYVLVGRNGTGKSSAHERMDLDTNTADMAPQKLY